ncbi:hypothetical protein F5884DRAFT_802432 [Xylogone sp. PMI_703]|nr:hypothetical protein F5884DRAFT_802432 [Xylogone sp. PMI_703]
MAFGASQPPDFRFVQVGPEQLGDPWKLRHTEEGLPISRRRPHMKSRHGCAACKKRKVKCDEGRPSCQNCVKRRETCSLAKETHREPKELTQRAITPSIPSPLPLSPDVNVLHMKLMHHFSEVTASTLIFTEDIWRKKVAPLSFEHDFLMQAILLTAATHLAHLQPSCEIYHRASMLHLHQTLRLFRYALTQPTTTANADALMATSSLLVHYAWDRVDGLFSLANSSESSEDGSRPPDDCRLDLGSDPLFSLAKGLRQVFTNAFHFLGSSNTIFASTLFNDSATPRAPRHALTEFITSINNGEMAETECDTVDLTGVQDLQSRLALVHSLCQHLPLQSYKSDSSSPLKDLDDASSNNQELCGDDPVMTVFYFPTCSNDRMRTLISQGDPSALIMMYFYYRAVEYILPIDRYWWTHKRATLLAPAIEQYLLLKGDKEIEITLVEGKRILHDYTGGEWSAMAEIPIR